MHRFALGLIVLLSTFVHVRPSAPVVALGSQAAPSIRDLAIGPYRVCLVSTAGHVYCWGTELFTTATPLTNTVFASTVVSLSLGYGHACARLSSGVVQCAGSNYTGQLGDGSIDFSADPVAPLLNGAAADSISASGAHTCARQADQVFCWGNNQRGQSGVTSGNTSVLTPTLVAGLAPGVRVVTTGENHNCAILITGGVRCWGANDHGQLGAFPRNDSPTPISVNLPAEAHSVALGRQHSCALLQNSQVWCWGASYTGQILQTDGQDQPPRLISGLEPVRAIAAGYDHTCALEITGAVACWGNNFVGQLGIGTENRQAGPTRVTGFNGGVTLLAASGQTTCALQLDQLKCWGSNAFNQLGLGITGLEWLAKPTIGTETASRLIAAGERHSCAVGSTLTCWGLGDSGELASDTVSSIQTGLRTTVSGTITAIDLGHRFGCAVISNAARCWGINSEGQLGTSSSTTANSATPLLISTLTGDVTSIAAGKASACAVKSGAVVCWGRNRDGELGVGVTTTINGPTSVSLGSAIATKVTAGDAHSCALAGSGAAYCWGDNTFGQLGDNSDTQRLTPVLVSGLSNLRDISAGAAHTCAVTAARTVKCWGRNQQSQVLDSDTSRYLNPVDVPGLTDIETISLGEAFSCALSIAGAVRCWGANYFGQLGDGKLSGGAPRLVVGLEQNVTAISVGNSHTCALLNTGRVHCWGLNDQGQVGTGTAWRNTPTPVLRPSAQSARGALLPLLTNGPPNEQEPNNSGSTANAIQLGQAMRGAFNDDYDVFKFTSTATGAFNITLTGVTPAADGGVQIQLYQRTETAQIKVGEKASLPYAFTTPSLPPGTYELVIFSDRNRPAVQELTTYTVMATQVIAQGP